MLKLRILTSLLLALLIFLAVIKLPLIPFALLCSGISLLAAKEWFGLATDNLIKQWLCLTFMVLLMGLSLLILWHLQDELPYIVMICIALWLLAFSAVFFFKPNKTTWLSSEWARLGLGVIFISVAWFGVVYLQATIGPWSVLLLLFTVWCADIGAYFTGKRFGKHKLVPKVSPGKTWEGLLGGIVLGLLIAFGFLRFLEIFFPETFVELRFHWRWFVVLLATILFSVLGDLFESVLKRIKGVKDSGRLLPGHGGLLDRIDALLAAVPVYVLGILLFVH